MSHCSIKSTSSTDALQKDLNVPCLISLPQESENPPNSTTPSLSIEPSDARRILGAADEILRQGEDFLRAIPKEQYTCGIPVAFNASMGGHYRHCLDHFSSLVRGNPLRLIDYDHRERDPRIESDPEFALKITQQLRVLLMAIPLTHLETPVQARCEVSYSHENSSLTRSTFGREMVYAIAHAIHHYALISVMARLMKATLPDHFGVAPSTVAHQKDTVRMAN